MKKFAVLTSILALTACGGGSGGGHSSVSGATNESRFQYDIIRAGTTGKTTANAANSNSFVTGMVSEIGLAEDGSTINIGKVGRSASNKFSYNGKEYTSYKLNDATFLLMDEGDPGEMKFHVKDSGEIGEIDQIVLLPDEEDLAEDPNDQGKTFNRYGNTNKFTGTVKIEDNNEVDTTLTYDSMGRDLGLTYSDFGGIDIAAIPGWRPVFIGGYDVKQIDQDKIAKDDTFYGKATGSVMAKRTINEKLYEDQENLVLNADAKLVFSRANGGTSTLTANFPNWYKIAYVEDKDNQSITFSDFKDKKVDLIDEEGNVVKNVSNYYKLTSDTGSSFTVNNTNKLKEFNYEDAQNPTFEEFNHINSNIRYFGDNNIASEAVGLVQLRDCAGGVCGEIHNIQINQQPNEEEIIQSDEVRMNLGFGVIKK